MTGHQQGHGCPARGNVLRLALLAMAGLSGVDLPPPVPADLVRGRPLREIVRQPRFGDRGAVRRRVLHVVELGDDLGTSGDADVRGAAVGLQ